MATLVEHGYDLSGLAADRKSAAENGCRFWSTDTKLLSIYDETAAAWYDVGGAPSTAIAGVTIGVGTESGDVINVTLQLTDAAGNDVAAIGVVEAYLSDDSGGDGITGTAPNANVVIGTDGTILYEPVTDKVFKLQSEADGDIDLNISDTGTPTFYLIVLLPNGEKVVSAVITFA